MRILVSVFLLFSSVYAYAQSPQQLPKPKTEDEIVQVERRWLEAAHSGDRSALKTLMAAIFRRPLLEEISSESALWFPSTGDRRPC